MKKLFIGLTLLMSVSLQAQTGPKFVVNDEVFKKTIVDAFQKSQLMSFLDSDSTIEALALFENKTCALGIKINSPKLKLTSGFSQSAKTIEKCQEKIAKYIAKDLGRI